MKYSKIEKIIAYTVIALVVACVAYMIWKSGSRRAIDGIEPPKQTEATGQTTLYVDDTEVAVNYLYAYDMEALVLHTKNYPPMDFSDKLIPKDLALGWGDVAKYNCDVDFHWKQSGRWYYWRVNTYEELSSVGVEADVNKQSSNNHVVAADTTVKRTIARIRRGDHVHLEGYLVELKWEDPEGGMQTWTSSTSRLDSGAYSCEVFYVTRAEILD